MALHAKTDPKGFNKIANFVTGRPIIDEKSIREAAVM